MRGECEKFVEKYTCFILVISYIDPASFTNQPEHCFDGDVTRVALAVQLLSSHPVLTSVVERVFSRCRDLCVRVLPPALTEAHASVGSEEPLLFLLDACSLRTDLGPLAARCRAQSPGSKFLALLPPGFAVAEEIRLFYWGIDGFLELHKNWQSELPKAVQSVLQGQPWVRREVLLAFVNHANSLLSTQSLRGHFLTAREGQVLQLLCRRLTNKEISSALGISERTAKFHVSNILSKLQRDDRRSLYPGTPVASASFPSPPSTGIPEATELAFPKR